MSTFATFFTIINVTLLAIAIGCAIGAAVLWLYKKMFGDWE